MLMPVLAVFIVNIASAQNLTEAEYFVDSDPGIGNGTSLSFAVSDTVNSTFSLNSSGLSQGLHVLYLRVKDDSGRWSVPSTRYFYLADTLANGLLLFNTDIIEAEYYFDVDPGPGKGQPISIQKSAAIDKNWVANTEGLEYGSHFLMVRTKSVDGFWGVPDTLGITIDSTACILPQTAFTFDTVDVNTSIGLTDLSSNV